jgi:hypothetical protein
MSNSLGIATVTSCLRVVLENAFTSPNNVDDSLSNASVTTILPSADKGLPDPGANVFLFQVTPNAAGRNSDLPTRNARGDVVARPRVALDLHYLVTFYGKDDLLEPQRLLGIAVRTLHRQPVFSSTLVDQAITQLVASHPELGFLQKSNLAAALEPVRLTPSAMSADELARIWSVFSFQTRFSLSLAYQASVLFVDADDVGKTALPVKTTNVYVDAGGPPEIDSVVPQLDPNAPITPEAALFINGHGFGSGDVHVVVDGVEVTTPLDVTPTRIGFTLPPLHAGTHGVQVARPRLMGSPPTPHQGLLSNLVAFVLAPQFVSTDVSVQFVFTSPADPDDDPPPEVVGPDTLVSGHLVITNLNPLVGQRQAVVVFLNELPAPGSAGTARAYTLPVDAPPSSAPAESNTVSVKFKHVVAGVYLVRLQVDGATSALVSESGTGRFIAPSVDIEAPP